MSTEPSREHVEAVARSISPGAYEEWPPEFVSMKQAISLHRRQLVRDLTSLLTSTDPAVLDAMQDALVRAGRLRVESDYGWRVPKMADRWGEIERKVDQVVRAERSHPQPVPIQKLKRTRLTSEWSEVEP